MREPKLPNGEERFVRQPHAPPHLFRSGATYFVTAKIRAGTWIVEGDDRRRQLVEALHYASEKRGWRLPAWVVLSNHYHCILVAPFGGEPLVGRLVASVHQFTALRWNREDQAEGRQVWYQYWDTCLTSEGGYWARLNYIHWNPVKHGLVTDPAEYPFSSYRQWQESQDADVGNIEQAYPWDRLELE